MQQSSSISFVTTETTSAVEFANTVHAVRGKLKDALPAWLDRHGFAEGTAEAARFAELRDAVRSLIGAAVGGADLPAKAVATVNTASAAAPFWTELAADGSVLAEKTTAKGAAAERGRIAREAIALLAGDDREALRSCQAPGCVLFFVKTHARQEFCGPVCGNRARAARHYARHKGE